MIPEIHKADSKEAHRKYVKQVWIAAGIGALVIVVLLLVKTLASMLLLILAGALVALFFQGLGSLIHRKTKIPEGISMLLGVLIVVGLAVGFFALAGFKIQSQITQLQETFPLTLENAKEQLQKLPLGNKAVEKLNDPKTQQQIQGIAATLFRSTFGAAGDIYIVLFLAIYFMVGPKVYKRGIIKLAPLKAQSRTGEILDKLGESLKKWIKGKLFAMLVVAVLSGIGLFFLDVPMWLTLALFAGIMNFIPNFGPLIAMVPAALVALMQGTATAGLVVGLYVLVQVVESNFITPMVQQKLLSIPPALIIIAQLAMATLTGGWGILLATPVVVIIMIVVQETYTDRPGRGAVAGPDKEGRVVVTD